MRVHKQQHNMASSDSEQFIHLLVLAIAVGQEWHLHILKFYYCTQ